MARQYLALTIAAILMTVGVLTACGSDTQNSATVAVTSSATASSPAGRLETAISTGTATSTTVATALSAPPGEVLYVAGDRLWLTPTDGGEPRRLIADEEGLEYEVWPEWSPDGSRVAFRGMSRDIHQDDIYVIDADGSNLRQLTDTPDAEQDIAWSPDGAWIAFAGVDNAAFIGVVAADRSMFLRLTDTFEYAGGPVWSPDGKEIAFHSHTGGSPALYIMEDDGANLRRITDDAVTGVFQPRWSPDGSRIVFTDGGFDNMYLIDAGGTNLVSLSERGAWGHAPRWPPDGSQIAYIGNAPESHEELYLVDSNGLNARQLTADGGRSIYYDWTEDGGQVIWAASQVSDDESGSTNEELRVINRDGSGQRVLVSGEAHMMTPKWRPTGATVEPTPQPTWPPELGTPVPTRTPTPPYVPTFETGPPWPEPDNGICEFSSPMSFPDVYLMNPDGSDVREVIGRGDGYGADVVWSPDGRSVIYYGSSPPTSVAPGVTPTADADGNIPGANYGIFQRDIQSGADTLLVAVGNVESLAWSSDGAQLAFTHHAYEGSTQRHWVVVVNADGSDPRWIAELPVGLHDIALSFTSEQPRLVYVFDNKLWVINAEGSGQQLLTDSEEYGFEPAWSPDGEVIFRASDGYQPDDWRDDPYLLYSVRPDGTNLRVLEPFERGDRQPSWSPDGRQIAFSRAGEIWLMDADGANRRNMTQHLSPDTAPAWSPDGSQILFRSMYRGMPDEVRRQPGQPRPIVLRHGGEEQEGMFMAACWESGNSRSVAGTGGGVPFPAEPLLIEAGDGASATIQFDFSLLGEPGTLSISVYDLAATRANGKGFGDDAIILPCAAPGGVEERCRVHDSVYQPGSVVDIELALPAGDYVIVVHSNVVSGSEYGYVEQTFHVRYGP